MRRSGDASHHFDGRTGFTGPGSTNGTVEFLGSAGQFTVAATAFDTLGASATSTANITVVVPPPGNDDFANRITISGVPVTVTGSTVGATVETGEPDTPSLVHTVWWSWTAPKTTSVSMYYAGQLNGEAVLYTGTSLSSLTPVLNAAGYYSVQQGTTYAIQVGGEAGSAQEAGSFSLTISQ